VIATENGAPAELELDSVAFRNSRSVWPIPTEANGNAICAVCDTFWMGKAPKEHCGEKVIQHYAAFPVELVRRMLAAGASAHGVCPECLAPWKRVTSDSEGEAFDKPGDSYVPAVTLGWEPTCEHELEPVPATALDPFAGSGTTLLVARKLGLHSIGVELNSDYARMIRARTGQQTLV
jgi:hypothetical protein